MGGFGGSKGSEALVGGYALLQGNFGHLSIWSWWFLGIWGVAEWFCLFGGRFGLAVWVVLGDLGCPWVLKLDCRAGLVSAG